MRLVGLLVFLVVVRLVESSPANFYIKTATPTATQTLGTNTLLSSYYDGPSFAYGSQIQYNNGLFTNTQNGSLFVYYATVRSSNVSLLLEAEVRSSQRNLAVFGLGNSFGASEPSGFIYSFTHPIYVQTNEQIGAYVNSSGVILSGSTEQTISTALITVTNNISSSWMYATGSNGVLWNGYNASFGTNVPLPSPTQQVTVGAAGWYLSSVNYNVNTRPDTLESAVAGTRQFVDSVEQDYCIRIDYGALNGAGIIFRVARFTSICLLPLSASNVLTNSFYTDSSVPADPMTMSNYNSSWSVIQLNQNFLLLVASTLPSSIPSVWTEISGWSSHPTPAPSPNIFSTTPAPSTRITVSRNAVILGCYQMREDFLGGNDATVSLRVNGVQSSAFAVFSYTVYGSGSYSGCGVTVVNAGDYVSVWGIGSAPIAETMGSFFLVELSEFASFSPTPAPTDSPTVSPSAAPTTSSPSRSPSRTPSRSPIPGCQSPRPDNG